jgi:hypothetical protein
MADKPTYQETAIGYGDIESTTSNAVIHVQKETSPGSGTYEDFKLSVNELRKVLGIPKRMVFVVSQSGANDPSMDLMLHNDFVGVAPILTRQGIAQYTCQFASPILVAGKTFVHLSNAQEIATVTPIGSGGAVDMQYFYEGVSKFTFVTIDGFSGINDDCMNGSIMTIVVYDYL